MDRVSTASPFQGHWVWGAFFPEPVRSPQVAERLPLGGEQTELQPAWQHLRLSRQWVSDEHSFTQPVLFWSWGHTPGFSSPAPGDGGSRESPGRIESSPTGIPTACSKIFTFLTPQTSSLAPGVLITTQRAPCPCQESLTLGGSLMLGFRVQSSWDLSP